MAIIEKENLKSITIPLNGSSYIEFGLNKEIKNESFGDFLWLGDKNKMEIEIDDLKRYNDFLEDGIENIISEDTIDYIEEIAEKYNII